MFKQAVAYVLAGVIVVGGLVALSFGMGFLDNTYLATVGKQRENVKREVFTQSDSYVNGMIEDLSTYKREFDRAEDIDEKEQIANTIDEMYANFDAETIENDGLYNFLMEIRNGEWR